MRNFTLLLLFIGFTFSCNDTKNDDSINDNALVGEWKLTAMKVSPGSVVPFVEVNSNRTLTFDTNGTFTCNGEFCSSTIDATMTTDGTYSLNNYTLSSTACTAVWDYTFTISADTLVIDYPSIETIQAKYTRQ
ncbi:hypothetical protein NBRC110019_15390 [Neptunitalea chrysea]|uniref:Lipocalin-like domain-containing protein n=1 Tax=Neptunitalea chrysea TaxID=1647581 RepID=A0A9W6B769_9FLAO|nr:lipocalin family protein [Neptunitalea chrysea]GLB52499.1 hypothetical protein NBRC110019_15390 [Neptunitalea chrysea]